MNLTNEQQQILDSTGKKVVVSASAGSGKTFVMIEKLISLICDKKVPVSRLLVLTFTKAAAQEMKSRLYVSMLAQKPNDYILQQIDDLSISDISTIDSFCEKIIKRNISKLDIDEGFSILDERGIVSLKKRAFQSAFEKFSLNGDKFNQLYFAFKKNKDRFQECIVDMQSYFDSLSNEQELRKDLLKNFAHYNLKSEEFLFDFIKGKIEKVKRNLCQAQMISDIPDKGIEFLNIIKPSIDEVDFNVDFYSLCQMVCEIKTPDLPRGKIDKTFKRLISNARDYVKECQHITINYKGISKEQIKALKEGKFAKALLEFYQLFSEKYAQLKARRAVLDFADIEKYAHFLLKDDEIKKSLQDKYDYIFIDEYQDTNRLQESILKPIAEGGYFTAVGDIKQGIYGFRNASKEIMLQDIAEFGASQDGQALYLTGNFRTDDKILSFVNDIFEKVMTEESVGIDYKDKSKLVGLQTFKSNGLVPVSVDICQAEKQEKVYRTDVYSVMNDSVKEIDKFQLELSVIESRINEVLGLQIYDAKNKIFRNVQQSDISLLFRSRSALMKECVRYLRSKGFSVEADIKNGLMEDGQIRLIVALLNLTINLQDDISLASVMASPFGGFSLQELSQIKLDGGKNEFNRLVLNSQDEKVVEFLKRINKFSFNCQVYGITKSLQIIFNECCYYEFLKTLDDGREKLGHINDLFLLIKENECDFKVENLISILQQNTKQKNSADGVVDALNVTTIHATKGLEYPIVLLCGSGDGLASVYNKNYILNTQFGLGTLVYDFDNDSQMPSPMFLAGKLKKAKEEFEGELMIFYVALTRAQNHLYIIGSGKLKDYSFDDIENQNNYLKLIMFALGENFALQLFEQGGIETPNRRFQVVSSVEQEICEIDKNDNEKVNREVNNETIKQYQQFSYKNKNLCKINYKETVTGVLNLEEDDIFQKENNLIDLENTIKIKSSIAIQTGNAYHEALKLIDIKKVYNEETFEREFEQISPLMTKEYLPLVNKNILYKNINLINGLIHEQKIFKEQEFIMNCPLKEIAIDSDEKIIVQGIVDFFAIGKKNILIDFKFTSTQDENVLIKRYKKQIELYSMAIEKAFNIKLDEKYLLSLKNTQLIKI
ncbi:MAG: hypothetical protein E7379_03545 [Clostridiales bacterium]|nr:hypothetical protein [Clostridiales bacterium]